MRTRLISVWLGLLVAFTVTTAQARKIPCTKVLSELHRVERFGALHGGDPGRIAKSLGTTTAWVEKCASTFGRRLQYRPRATQRRLLQEPIWESAEEEELGEEERETEDDILVNPIPYRDKVRARNAARRKQDWRPYEHGAWEIKNKAWSPYLTDPHRSSPDDAPGLVR